MPTPVLIFDDTAYRSQLQSAWAAAKTAAQNIVTLYDAIGLDALTPSEFAQLFTDVDGLLFDKITGGTLSFGGIEINKTEGLKLLQMPAGTDALKAALAQFAKDGMSDKFSNYASAFARFDSRNIGNYFVLDGSNVVQYSTALNTQITNAGKVYATTDKQIAMFRFVEDVTAAFYTRGLDAYFGHYRENPIPDIIARAMENIDRTAHTVITNKHLQAES